MTYFISAGIVASYGIFWFAMTEPVGKVPKQLAAKVRNKLSERRAKRASKSKPVP